jgi:hypothetical protein
MDQVETFQRIPLPGVQSRRFENIPFDPKALIHQGKI